MNRLLAAIVTLGVLALAPQYASARNATDKGQIEQVIETFRTAILNKDKDKFLTLFLKDDITWTGVTTDASVERLYATRPNPEWARPLKIFNSSPREFIGFIAKDKSKVDEVISNVRIDSDGDIAQVWFDYSFMFDNHKENWGKESWQMVRLETGWKIAAVIWSQDLNPMPPAKDGGL
jgi:hypothetical protein